MQQISQALAHVAQAGGSIQMAASAPSQGVPTGKGLRVRAADGFAKNVSWSLPSRPATLQQPAALQKVTPLQQPTGQLPAGALQQPAATKPLQQPGALPATR